MEYIILGIIQGITEFFPISSTAHLLIVEKIFNIHPSYPHLSNTIMQMGSVLAIMLYYNKTILTELRYLFSGKLGKLTVNLVISFIPTAFFGLLVYKYFKEILDNYYLISINLILGGIIIIIIEKFFYKKSGINDLEKITKKDALIIGLAQVTALIPGVSRLGSTVIAGLLLGFTRKNIIEYSFLLNIPVSLAASLHSIYKSYGEFSNLNFLTEILTPFLSSFITSLIFVSLAIKLLSKISFLFFGYYRVAIGLGLLFIIEKIY